MIRGGGKLRGGDGGWGERPFALLRAVILCMYGWLKRGESRDGEGGILLKRSKLRRREYGGSLGSITLPYQLAIYIFHSLGNSPARPHMSSFLVWLHTTFGGSAFG